VGGLQKMGQKRTSLTIHIPFVVAMLSALISPS
jgi:hypothetical protein